MKEEWLMAGAVVPVDVETTAALVAEIRRLIDVVGGLVLAQPAQEPVAWVCFGEPGKRDIDFEEADINGLPIGTNLYTDPPAQRPWQGLTDDDRFEIAAEQHGWEDLLTATEAKLKERNT